MCAQVRKANPKQSARVNRPAPTSIRDANPYAGMIKDGAVNDADRQFLEKMRDKSNEAVNQQNALIQLLQQANTEVVKTTGAHELFWIHICTQHNLDAAKDRVDVKTGTIYRANPEAKQQGLKAVAD